MSGAPNSLVLDLVEWVAAEPRPYAAVMEAWRTSCPRLTVWEDAVDRGYVRKIASDGGTIVTVTSAGLKFLRGNNRVGPQHAAVTTAVRARVRQHA